MGRFRLIVQAVASSMEKVKPSQAKPLFIFNDHSAKLWLISPQKETKGV